jgi:hypothetical protein
MEMLVQKFVQFVAGFAGFTGVVFVQACYVETVVGREDRWG